MVPVPVNDCVVVEFEALLMNDAVPDAAPLDAGANVMVKVLLCPALIVAGSSNPLMVNSEEFTLADETVTAAPLALKVPVSGLVDPTVTDPKARGDGVTLNVPRAVPVPDIEMLSDGFVAFEVTEMFPLAAVAEAGVKVALKVTL